MDQFTNFNSLSALLSISLLLYGVRWWYIRRRSGGLPYPPGPRPDPIIGNLRQIPDFLSSPWLTFTEWGKTYGDVVSVEALGTRTVILNSVKAATELLDKRANIYSERPHNVMLQELMKDRSIAFMPYTAELRAQRKIMSAALNPSVVVDYIPIQERETHALLDRILNSPERYYDHIKRAIGASLASLAHGHVVVSDDDEYIQVSENTFSYILRAVIPGTFFVNVFPILKYVPSWFPGAGFQKFSQEGEKRIKGLKERFFQMVKQQMLEGKAPMSYTTRLLKANGSITNNVDEEENIKSTAFTLYGAGTETTLSSFITFILAMVLHPDIQKKAHAEMDAVVGQGRLPNLADRSSLPYLNTIMLEVLRWKPVTPIGVPHAVAEDDEYEGLFIPKDSIVISNIWAMMHDQDMYPNPEAFWPERFDGRFPNIKDPRTIAFGFGRRVCPGRHLAMNSLFLAMACLIATCDFSKARDGNGNEIEPVIDYSPRAPLPFKCRITPRSKEAAVLVRDAAHKL